jgi:hypothetical protein
MAKKFTMTQTQWEALVKASVRVNNTDDVPKIAALCVEHDCGTWHAAAMFYGHLNRCPCATCIKARAEALR